MGYIDSELGIKSVAGIKKYFNEYFKSKDVDVQLDCVKNGSAVITFWAINNYLHQHRIEASKIYFIQEESLDLAILAIEESLKQR